MEGSQVPWECVEKHRRHASRVCPGKSRKALWEHGHPTRFFKEEQELDRCEGLWVRGKRNGLEHAVKRKPDKTS